MRGIVSMIDVDGVDVDHLDLDLVLSSIMSMFKRVRWDLQNKFKTIFMRLKGNMISSISLKDQH